MKKCAYLLTILVIFALFGLKTYAEEDFDDYISDFEDLLPEDMDGETMDRLSVEGILSGVVESVKGERGRLGVLFLTTLGVICLSALASLAPPLPREPEYFRINTPPPKIALLFFSDTSGKFGSNATPTSAERQVELLSASRRMISL